MSLGEIHVYRAHSPMGRMAEASGLGELALEGSLCRHSYKRCLGQDNSPEQGPRAALSARANDCPAP